jgi:manganese transport protein
VKQSAQMLLGVLTAVGGFIELGDLVFLSQTGAQFRYQALWAVPVGVIGIGVYAEMCGRVAATSGKAVFEVVRERLGFSAGLSTLMAGQFVTLLTLAAEIGGVAIVLQLLFDLPNQLLIAAAGLVFLAVIWAMPFEWIERLFGLMGLGLLVFVVSALDTTPDWGALGEGLVPSWNGSDPVLYGYFAVGVVAAAFMPYEIYFYSSGGIEEGWERPALRLNRMTVIFGWSMGLLLAMAIMVTAAQVLEPRSIQPELLGTVGLGVQLPLGDAGLLIGLLGMLFAIGGATAETALSCGYNIAQFLGWEWGKFRRPSGAPRFTLTAMVMLIIGVLIIITGLDAVQVTELAVIFGVVALPLSYLPVLLVANDPTYMGDQTNGRLANVLGWLYFVLISVVALAAVPLMIATNMGQS